MPIGDPLGLKRNPSAPPPPPVVSLSSWRRIHTDDVLLNRIQDATRDAFHRIDTSRLANAILLLGVKLKTGQDNRIPHGLGCSPLGYFVVRLNDAAAVYDSPTANKTPDKVLLLRASADVTVSLLVF